MIAQRLLATMLGGGALVIGLGFGVMSSGTFEIDWDNIDAGGTVSTSATYELIGTIGQPDVGFAMAGGEYELVGGFWSGAGIPAPVPEPSCIHDIAPPGGDGVIGIADLLAVIGEWGMAGGDADIAPEGGDGVVGIADMLAIIGAWGVCPE